MTEHQLAVEIGRLLRQDLPLAREREQSSYDRLVSPFDGRLVLFGAGGLGRKTLAGLRRMGITPLAFADNNPRLLNTEVDGLRVLAPADAAHLYHDSALFVITVWGALGHDRMKQRRQLLTNLGCRAVAPFLPLFWKYADVFLPFYAVDLPHKVHEQADRVQQACSLWADESSRREYLAQVQWRLFGDFDVLPDAVGQPMYFPADVVKLVRDEALADCGAYDGDTLAPFLQASHGAFRSVDAFEPDPGNFGRLEQAAAALPEQLRSRVHLHRNAVGSRTGKVRFEATGTAASTVGTGSLEVECVRLDDVLEGRPPTFIKMDIEGAELDALLGARRLIQRGKPLLALSAYHLQDHLWQIPLFLHSLSDRYRFFLRPHRIEVWDLVCYAVPEDRLVR
jgi:FkbM family methyltransferase